MPSKELDSPFDNDGITRKFFKFGGGANTIFTANGFAAGYIIETGGGDDAIFGSDIGAAGSGIGDELTGGDGSDTIFGGLGDDIIRGGNVDGSDASKGKGDPPTSFLVGDGQRLSTGQFSAYSENFSFMNGVTTFNGGYDQIYGSNNATSNLIYGDVAHITMGGAHTFNGGWDILRGGNDTFTNSLYGDGQQLNMQAGSDFNGGNDYLRGGDSTDPNGANVTNDLLGDVQDVTTDVGSFTGGNDKLVGGSGTAVQIIPIPGSDPVVMFDVTNTLTGDTGSTGGLGANFQGGNDILISGAYAADTMHGDWVSGAAGGEKGGEDTFVLGPNNGRDIITDFRTTDTDGVAENGVGDTINLAATGLIFADLDDNVLGGDGVIDDNDSHVTVSGTTMVIDLGQARNDGTIGVNTITLYNVASLTSDSFDFTNVIDPDSLIT